MTKYDIGILGLWWGCNYGSIATYYALHQVLTSMGKTVLMIDKPIIKEKDVEREYTHSRRFANEHYVISEQYCLQDLYKLNELCDAFVIGSDQVWNYGISKNFGKIFYFDFAEKSKKKIAYAVSFGHGKDFAPDNERKIISEYMKKFDGISIREDEGVKLCNDIYGVNATQVIDPVFLADPSIYEPLIEKSDANVEEPYLLTYFLDPTPEKREAILHIAKELGNIKVINMLDGLPWLFQKNKEALNLPNCVENLQVEDWLKYIKNATFVMTDSCHGASFAIIFKRNFIAVTNSERGFSRFKSLSKVFQFEKRLVTDPKRILTDKILLEPMDYNVIDEIMNLERKRCYEWLNNVLNSKTLAGNKLPNEMCMGCGACVSICPKEALSLKQDILGYYRSVLDKSKCINCSLCVKTCPSINLPLKTNSENPECYAFIAKDEDTLKNSSSGAIFPLLANQTLNENGAVFGAAWKEDFTVEHIMINSKEELEKLKKSKYLQSYLGDIDRKVKEELDKGRKVLFSGCPCQIAGLKSFLSKEYENLILVDLLCGNSPSSLFFKKYLESSFPQGVKDYQFRYKKQGWNSDCLTLTLTNGEKIERRGANQDLYQKVYHSHIMCPPHCENCKYQSLPRFGDITIGDFWGYSKRDSSVDVTRGISVVLCNNEKGKQFFHSISEENIELKKSVPLEWIGGNGYALPGKHNWISPLRDKFYKLIQDKSFLEAVKLTFEEEDKTNVPITTFPLCYDSYSSYFRFDSNMWEEHFINNKTVLITKQDNPPFGNFAVIPFRENLKPNTKYTFDIRFKINSNSKEFNLHIVNKDTPKQKLQILKSLKRNDGFHSEWIEIHESFVTKSGEFNGFGIGAAQLSGKEAYFMVDYIIFKERGL